MENEYLDSYERAKRADRERRSHARQMKRRRQKRLKMIKGAITAAVAVVVAVCCILYTTRGEGGGLADGIDSQQMAQDAMQALAQISEPEQKFKYPSVSENYKEIVSEEVKSPYVALLDVENSQVIAGRGYNEGRRHALFSRFHDKGHDADCCGRAASGFKPDLCAIV